MTFSVIQIYNLCIYLVPFLFLLSTFSTYKMLVSFTVPLALVVIAVCPYNLTLPFLLLFCYCLGGMKFLTCQTYLKEKTVKFLTIKET